MSNNFYLDEIKKCVTFIFYRRDNEMIPLGTGFFVGVQFDKHHIFYLVTAKHVIFQKDVPLTNLHIRLNKNSGGAEYIDIGYSKDHLLTHNDENVDVIAFPCFPPLEIYKIIAIPEDLFLPRYFQDEMGIREGSNVFFAGLFSNYFGKKENHPIVRFGRISLLGEEKIEINNPGEPIKSAHLYLIECNSLGGFSGSPVFFESDRITPRKIYYNTQFHFGGIMKGHYNDMIETHGIVRELNAGLALVTPCYLLKEILHSKKAIEQREKIKQNKPY
jgi:hypothetical protein